MWRQALVPIAAAATAVAAASARHDYVEGDRLSARTQTLMWPAYLLGAAVIASNARHARSNGTRGSVCVGGAVAGAGLCCFLGGARRFNSFAQLAGRETGGLITGGIYRYSRNPQYVGNLLVSAGSALAARSVSGIAFTLVAAGAYRAYVPAEEAHMERAFGDDYRRYRQGSARWLGPPPGPDPADA